MSKISLMTPSGALDGSEIFPLVKAGGNVNATTDDVKTFVSTSIGSVVVADELLTDINSTVLDIVVNSSTVYQIDAMLFLENPNTDGLIFDIGVYDLTTDIFNIGYVAGANFGIMEMGIQEVISDVTGVSFIKMSGIISVTGTGGTMTVTARVDNLIIGTTSVLKGSYILATKI